MEDRVGHAQDVRRAPARRGSRAFAIAAIVTAALLGSSTPAAALPIDFEAVEDVFGTGVVVDAQFAADGVTFSNALALTAGISLNEFDFPPRSGQTAVSDFGGALAIDFSTPFYGVEAFFTYFAPLTMQAFDASGALIGQTNSLFASNLAFGGDLGATPNERLAFSSSVAIARVVITGDPFGGSFLMDDFNAIRTPPSTAVPEPHTLTLLALGVGAAAVRRRRGNTNSSS
jgi:hypothetical protein